MKNLSYTREMKMFFHLATWRLQRKWLFSKCKGDKDRARHKPWTSSERYLTMDCWSRKNKVCTFQVKLDQLKGIGCIKRGWCSVCQNAPTCSIPHQTAWSANTELLKTLGFVVVCRGLASTGQPKSKKATTLSKQGAGPAQWKENKQPPDHQAEWGLPSTWWLDPSGAHNHNYKGS